MKNGNLSFFWEKVQALTQNFLEMLPNLSIGIVILILFYVAGKITRNTVRNVMKNHKHYNLSLVAGRLAQWTLTLLGILIALAIVFPSITTADIVGGLGVGSIALGFAFKDILQNYLAGILILIQQPFKIGDEIKYKEFEGQVEFIDTRATFLKSYDGRRILIPNGEIYINVIVVNTSYTFRCSEYDIGIGTSDDLEKASNIILKVLSEIDSIATAPAPEILAVSLNDFSNILRARWWTSPYQRDIILAKSFFIKKIKKSLYEEGIDLPYPTQVVLWHDQTEQTDGDRNKQREGWPPGQSSPAKNTLASAISKLIISSDNNSAIS
jgi:small conductance mechanosensitive channel